MTLLSVKNLSLTLRDRVVLQNISFEITPGEVVGLIGPNGAGKTSLMRAVLGLVPAGGDSSIAQLSNQARARAVAWMPQSREIAWPIAVERLVALGRLSHLPMGRDIPAADKALIDAAIAQMGLNPLRNRAASRLSGGEQARALIARALAQDTPLLMADEPIAGLDPAHQISTMQVFSDVAAQGRGVLVSIHDLGLAARHCSRLILLADQGIMADGTPQEVLTPDNMARAFGVRVWHEVTSEGAVFQPLEVLEPTAKEIG